MQEIKENFNSNVIVAASRPNVIHGPSLLTEHDIYLFKEGSHFKLYEKLGSHIMEVNGVKGTYFAVWAPNAKSVHVMGDFNFWNKHSHPLGVRWDSSGIWEGFIPGIGHGTKYKYHIESKDGQYSKDKGDPFAKHWEIAPRTASVVWDLKSDWGDSAWMRERFKHNSLGAPISVYEMHLGSWRRVPEAGNRFLNYREIADQLVPHIKKLGFTHIEIMPVMEHPFYGSWGYQCLGYFAPTSRFGTPEDFMYLMDTLHKNGIGVILDWVPSHFPADDHGLAYFDGSHLFEHADPRKGFHPDWKSYIFNYGRHEVRSFLISSALFWMDKFHADGLRIDGVASMLYLDYSRKAGEWIPNNYGGRENLEAVEFIKRLNTEVYRNFPDVVTVAEESTAWPMVTRPVSVGGLGFGMKWNMGWMHDTLEYITKDPIYRKYHHDELTFSVLYAFSENFCLSLSHDEVVHGKASLLSKMPGDDWQKFANLRLLLAYMYMHPGKKLLFMGVEMGQWSEWEHEQSLDWHLLQWGRHQAIFKMLGDLNRLYKDEGALHEIDFEYSGFEWVDYKDYEKSIIAFIRKGYSSGDMILVVCNFTPTTQFNYRVGVPHDGYWQEIFNSDSGEYWGSGKGNLGGFDADNVPYHGRPHSLNLTVPPLGVTVLKHRA